MSLIGFVKELWGGAEQLSEKKYGIIRINMTIRLLAAILLVGIWLNDRWGLGIRLLEVTWNLWEESLRKGLNQNIYGACIFWVLYDLIGSRLLELGCVIWEVEKNKKTKLSPLKYTLDDLIDFGCSVFFLMYAINQLIEYNNGTIHDDFRMCVVAGIYIAFRFAGRLYVKNCRRVKDRDREYTDFYDINNKRIPKEANVIYRGKRYRLYWTGNVIGLDSHAEKPEWRLDAWGGGETFSLEDAVKDREGNLTVESNVYDAGE